MRHIILPMLVLLSACSAVKDLKVAQSLTDKNVASKPAQIQVTIPKDGDRTYVVDAGVGYTHSFPVNQEKKQQTDLTIGAEYHRNTVTDNPKDSTIASLRLDQIRGDITEHDDPITFPGIGLNFKKDRVKGTESIVPSFDITWRSNHFRIGDVIGRDGPVGFEWQPTLGTEVEFANKAEANNPTGRVGRVWGSLDANLYPAWGAIRSRLQLAGTLRLWQDYAVTSRIDNGRDRHYLRTLSLNYFFDDESRFAVGIDRVSGENPSEGEPDQHYTEISFKVHLR
jgi:hypothetical protein